MHKLSLSDISYETGLRLLVMRKYALDKGDLKRIPKEKLAETDLYTNIDKSYRKQANILGDLKSQFQGLTPEIQRGLIGAGAGAGIGSLAGLYSAKDKDKKTKINKGLSGGLSGAALLGGLGFISPTVTSALSNLPVENKTPTYTNKTLDQIKNLPNVSLDEKQRLFDANNIVDSYADRGYGKPAVKVIGSGVGGALTAPWLYDKLIRNRTIFQRLKQPYELLSEYASGLSSEMADPETKEKANNKILDLVHRITGTKPTDSKIIPAKTRKGKVVTPQQTIQVPKYMGSTSEEVLDNLKNYIPDNTESIKNPNIRDLMAKQLDLTNAEDLNLYKNRDIIENIATSRKGRAALKGVGATAFGGLQLLQEYRNAAKQMEAVNTAKQLLDQYGLQP
jgi:hypothetical protein